MSDATVTESAAPAKTPVRRRSTSVATGKTTARAAKAEAPKDAEQKKPAARKQAARAAKPAQPSDTNGSQPAQPSSAGDSKPTQGTSSKPTQGTGTKPAQGTGTKPTQASNTRPVQTNNNANRPNNRPNNSRPNNNGGKQQGNNGSNQRRQRRPHNNNQGPREVQPSVSRDDLLKLKVAELRAKAEELGVDGTGLKKAELIEAVFSASVKAEGFIEVSGILDILADGYGFLRTQGYLPSETDCYVGLSTIRRNGLRKGDLVSGQTRPARENEKYAAIQKVTAINGTPIEECGNRLRFGDLTPVYPDECLSMEHGKTTVTARVIDLVSPIGKGQRGLIVSPPKAGKTTILKDIAAAISANNPEVHLMCLLVDERPEEVTDMERSIKGEVVSSTFDMPTENHIAVSELVIERAKRLVECGKDVVVLLDSLTRLARAYNLAQPASGRILSGGVDSTALYPPKRFLGAARNIEGGGSLTILASALVDTGSKMDEVIFEEFKGTGNMELKLDRNLADRRIFPAIDPVASGTRKEELLLDPQEAPLIWAVRRILANTNNTERAMDMLIKSLKQTDTNQEFLLRTAKKAQHSKGDAIEI
ncbi:MAG: transcription termination factor Rho [Gordonibacter sp.]